MDGETLFCGDVFPEYAMARLETAFGDWELDADGTATDLSRGLMWMRRPVGFASGVMFSADWPTMASKYGQASIAFAPSADGRADAVAKATQLSPYSLGYTRGTELVRFGSFTDWRLPTLDEVVHLTFSERWGARRVKQDGLSATEIWKELFDFPHSGAQFWTANPLWKAGGLTKLFSKALPVAWAFGDAVICDDNGEALEGAVLVRQA